MKDRPILFSGPMVRAILAGTKTQTRRVANRTVRHPDLGNLYTPGAMVLEREPKHVIERACPYGAPGHRLWVREAWGWNPDYPDGVLGQVQYRADPGHFAGTTELDDVKWKPSIHMPRAASRITLEIADVRVERLQAISHEDAIAEGIEALPSGEWRDYLCPNGHSLTPGGSFRTLWQSINGPDSWEGNPWVWVVEFKRLED